MGFRIFRGSRLLGFSSSGLFGYLGDGARCIAECRATHGFTGCLPAEVPSHLNYPKLVNA